MFYEFKLQIKKLEKFVREETSLEMDVNADSYPLRISFSRKVAQLSLLDKQESAEGDEMIDASTGEAVVPSVTFEFNKEMRIITAGKFKIADAIFSRLKSLSKEANRLFLNEFCEAMIVIRKDMRELGWAKQIGNEIDAADGVPRILCIINPTVLVEFLDIYRGRVHGADVWRN